MTTGAPSRSTSWWRTAIVIVAVSLVTLVLQRLGLLDHFETAGLDAFNILKPVRDPTDIVLIGIQDTDYFDPTLFNGTSPLNCATVRRILHAIADGQPALIGVDLDTSASSFSCLSAEPSWPPIVWVEDAVWTPESKRLSVIPAVGGTTGLTRSGTDSAGIGALPEDSDGVIRRYYRELPLDTGQMAASFPWAVIQAGCGKHCQRCCEARERAGTTEALRLNFAGERFNFEPLSVRHVLDASGSSGSGGWHDSGPLVGKIVLLGGTYRAARDVHATPVGPMNGVQIMAQAIESELHGGGIRAVHEGLMFAFDLLLGSLLALLHYRLHDRTTLALAISLLLMPLLCLLASYLVFSTLGLWFNFAAVVVSVLIHQLHTRASENQRLRAAAR